MTSEAGTNDDAALSPTAGTARRGPLLWGGLVVGVLLLAGYWVWASGPPGLAAVRAHMAEEQFAVGEPIVDSLGLILVPIPAGEFVMGAKFNPKQPHDRTMVPPHRVTLTKPFRLAAFEVTQRQFEELMDERPWDGQPLVRSGANRAATYVSWAAATEFCKRLGEREGAVYRLPTEAEWEYACRAGTTSRFGLAENEKLGDRAWFHGNAYVVGNQYPHVVGTREPNDWALFDVQGNAWEWCADWFGGYGEGKPRTDPTGPAKGRIRVSRGGGFASQPPELTCATRASFGRVNYRPEFMAGFRVVREID